MALQTPVCMLDGLAFVMLASQVEPCRSRRQAQSKQKRNCERGVRQRLEVNNTSSKKQAKTPEKVHFATLMDFAIEIAQHWQNTCKYQKAEWRCAEPTSKTILFT